MKLKRFSLTVGGSLAILVGVLCSVAVASAQSDNPIWSGLQSGVNIATGTVNNGRVDKPRIVSSSAPVSNTPVASTAVAAKSNVYAALGDSVAAGLGLPLVPNATAQDTQCGRSTQAYGYSVAQTLHTPLVHVACSGATVGDLFTKQHVDGPNIPPQLDAAFAKGTPKYISITAGANDAHWSDFVQKCYVATCGTSADTTTANLLLATMQLKLHYLFLNIWVRSNGRPPAIVITGYYNPFSEQCLQVQQNITADELSWLNGEEAALNKTIQQVSAQYQFVKFTPVDFTGHDICSAQPWVQGVSDPAPFHPTVQGQAAIAQAVTRSFGY